MGVATQLPGAKVSAVRGAARGLVATVLDGQLESHAQAALPHRLQQRNVTATARAAALSCAPFRAVVKLYGDASALLVRSARWVLPLFFTVRGLASPNPHVI